MTPPPPQLRGMLWTLTDFVSAVPHSNHHTVGAASWQNHDRSPPQSVFILHSNVCLGLSNPYISCALWGQRESKNTAHYIPILLRGLGEAVATNDWCIIYTCVLDGTREARVVQWDAGSYIQDQDPIVSIFNNKLNHH